MKYVTLEISVSLILAVINVELVIFVFGLIAGSFINVVAIRLPVGGSFVTGRSHCPDCNATLNWYELIPLFSFLILRGKCRTCHSSISWRYFFIELASGLLWVLLFQAYGDKGAIFFLSTVFVAELLLILALIDLNYLIIPDSILISILIISLFRFIPSPASFLSAFGMGGFFWILWRYSHGVWVGLGDAKLLAVLGLVFGFPGSILVAYGAIIIGGFIGIALIVFRQANLKTQIPFGTILAGCAIIYLIYAKPILEVFHRYIPIAF